MGRLKESGFSMVEALIASSIVAVAAVLISKELVTSTRNSVELQGMALCRTRAQMIIQTFKNADNKASVSNWIASSSTLPAASPHPELGIYPIVTSQNGATIPTNTLLIPELTNSWELIDNGTNWALSLVKSNPLYCVSTRPPNPPGKLLTAADTASFAIYSGNHLMPPPSNLNQEKDYLSINLVSNTGVPARCPYGFARVIPVGPNTRALPQNSILVTGTVTYVDEFKHTVSCDASTTLRPDGTSVPPVFINPLTIPGALLTTGTCGALPSQLCLNATSSKIVPPNGPKPMVACDSQEVSVSFQVNESATVFGCNLQYATTAAGLGAPSGNPPTSLCINNSDLVAGGVHVNFSISPYTGSSSYGSGGVAHIAGSPLPEGFYRLYIKAFDAAQNTAFQHIDFGVDNTRPTTVTITPPTPLISNFNAFAATTRSHFFVPPPWSTAVNFGTELFQCENSVPTDLWSVTTSAEPIPVSAAGASWAYAVNGGPPVPITSAATCPTQIPSPVGLPSGNYVMYAFGCDQCGTAATTTTSVPWTLDLGPSPAPAHAPTALPMADFNTSGLVSWNLSVAKPAPLPFQYACQNVSGTFSSQSSSCTPTGLSTNPCTEQGSKGMCTSSYDGCGRGVSDSNSPYEVAAGLGQSCCNVPCRNDENLICAMDNTVNRGYCVAKTSCTLDSQCGGAGAVCFLDSNTCHGTSNQIAPQTCP